MIKKYKKGFTLVEMLLVVVILGVLAAMTVPNFSKSFFGLKLQETTNNISYLMRYAQSRAITKNQQVRLVLDESSMHYWLLQGSSSGYDENAQTDYQQIPNRWGRQFEIPLGITVEATNPTVEFYPDGKIEKVQIKVCYNDRCMIVSTETQRGKIHVFESS